MDYTVSPERAALLAEKFFEFSFDNRQPDRAFFDAITNPAELHLIAGNYNWDDGAKVLTWIVDSPRCDKATAVMLFWHAQPSYYTRFYSQKEAEWDKDVFRLLRRIMKNVASGFYQTALIAYDPQTDPKAEGVDEIDPKAKWSIPDVLKQPLVGPLVVELE